MRTIEELESIATYNGDGDEVRIPIMDLSTAETAALCANGWEYRGMCCECDGYMWISSEEVE